MSALVQVNGVHKYFTRGSERIDVLKGVNLRIPQGDFVALMGPSGSGKTTLLNLLGGLDTPSGGSVEVGGTNIAALSGGQLSRWRASNIGFVFQLYNLLPVLTAERNVDLPLLLTNLSKAERKKRVAIALNVVGLAERAKHYPRQLSGGQEQRVGIARAIVTDPTLLLCDEPTGDLDAKASAEILTLLQTLNKEHGKTIVMVTHDPSLTSRTHRNIIISDGELIDETIARALPQLRHRHMLEFTKLVEERVYQPHETIISRDEPVDYFFMIREGEVEVILQDKRKKENVISRLNNGEFFGEMELLRGGKSIANVRAGSSPVVVLALPRADFARVMSESPITAEAVAKTVQKRLEKHRVADYRHVDK